MDVDDGMTSLEITTRLVRAHVTTKTEQGGWPDQVTVCLQGIYQSVSMDVGCEIGLTNSKGDGHYLVSFQSTPLDSYNLHLGPRAWYDLGQKLDELVELDRGKTSLSDATELCHNGAALCLIG